MCVRVDLRISVYVSVSVCACVSTTKVIKLHSREQAQIITSSASRKWTLHCVCDCVCVCACESACVCALLPSPHSGLPLCVKREARPRMRTPLWGSQRVKCSGLFMAPCLDAELIIRPMYQDGAFLLGHVRVRILHATAGMRLQCDFAAPTLGSKPTTLSPPLHGSFLLDFQTCATAPCALSRFATACSTSYPAPRAPTQIPGCLLRVLAQHPNLLLGLPQRYLDVFCVLLLNSLTCHSGLPHRYLDIFCVFLLNTPTCSSGCHTGTWTPSACSFGRRQI